MKKSVVLFSGGLDSTVTLYKAKEQSDVQVALFIAYGQRHEHEELAAAKAISEALEVNLMVQTIPLTALGGGLVGKQVADRMSHLSPDLVPGRNMILLALAAGIALRYEATQIWTGVSKDDYDGFPDCRPGFIEAAELALKKGLEFGDLEIVTPVSDMTKADMFSWANQDPLVFSFLLDKTHTCYLGVTGAQTWGRGCGNCGSCTVRKRGYYAFRGYPAPSEV